MSAFRQFLLLALLAATAARGAVIHGLRDHSLCCGLKAPTDFRSADYDPLGDPALLTEPYPATRPSSPAIPAPAAPAVIDGRLRLGFDVLAGFPFASPLTGPATPIPAGIRRYDNQPATVTGFMLPLKLERGLATEFLLMASASLCCYGVIPQLNQYIVVRAPRGVEATMDVPREFHGRLRVGELRENGVLVGIYQLEVDE